MAAPILMLSAYAETGARAKQAAPINPAMAKTLDILFMTFPLFELFTILMHIPSFSGRYA